jgi:hypothetical protein
MHTAICAFDSAEQARAAVDALLRSGFSRDDVHIEHEASTAEGRNDHNRRSERLDREVGHDRGVLSSFGAFFASLLGRDHTPGHLDTYTQHVERGCHVVVVDAVDESEARRASTLLHDLQAADVNVVHRPAQPPVRELVAGRQQDDRGEAGMASRSRDNYESTGSVGESPIARERERAVASPHIVSPVAGPSLRDPEAEHAPGLRYADKDKPL